MNWKVILGLIAALIGVYYGADWLHQRDTILSQLQTDPLLSQNAGHFFDFSMKKSAEPPMCGSHCEGVKRYLIKIRGEKETLLMAADYDKNSKQIRNRIYCKADGNPLRHDANVALLHCR
ncbi:MAG: hypothetical protein Q4G42_04510 [Neisseria sp.]|nr:hypothetical protein [Neisseria sp.]